MPISCDVTEAGAAGPGTAGEYLAEMAVGRVGPADVIVLPVGAGGQVAGDLALDRVLGRPAAEIVAASQLNGRPGQIAPVPVRAGQVPVKVVFLGVGDHSAGSLRRAGGELGRTLRPGQAVVSTVTAGQPASAIQAFCEGLRLGTYRYSEKSGQAAAETTRAPLVRLLGNHSGSSEAISGAAIFANAVSRSRDIANTPSVRKSPEWLAEQARKLAAETDLGLTVWSETELASAGFGGLTAVGAGSDRPPRLIELRYEPAGASRHVALIGKGITFDSGGLSLKPGDAMKAMKTDLAGGAAVLAVMTALGALGVRHRVTGLIAAAENMPSGAAYRPGDVITQYGGRTVEVLNTDAEGRLVLADALAYADAKLGPDEIVDIATLTGAARIALGTTYGALFASSDDLAERLLAAGQASGDRLWRLPLPDDYRPGLDSPVADLAHVARDAGSPGAISAALFLREFTGGRPWAHLDIAGAGRCGADDGDLSAGATGFGTRLLLRWLLS